LPAVCRIAASSNLRGTQTWLDETRNRRAASAPWRSMTSHGLTTFPLLFDIFDPVASSTRSFTTTARYGAADSAPTPPLLGSASPSPVAMASME
jgi:hypothetical protein